MTNKISKIIIICLMIFSLAIPVGFCFAEDNNFTTIKAPELKDYGPGSWESLGENIINYLALVAGTAFIIMLLVGGVMFITSAGNEEQAKKAQGVLTNAILGIVVVVMAWGIISFVVENVTK